MKRKTNTNPFKKTLLKSCLILFLALFSNSVSAQISVKASNKSIKEILKVVETKSAYRFFYNEDLQGLNKISTIKVKDVSIDEILAILLTDTEIDYKIDKDNLIILVNKINVNQGELKKINGLVSDEKGEPIIGASILIKGSKQGTITDANGRFSIDVNENSTLLISYIGYKTTEYIVGQQKNILIKIEKNTKELDEVVVVAYGTMKKSDVNAAIVSIKPVDLEINTSSSITQTLAGRAAGLTVLGGSAQPGGGQEVLVRGAASVGAGNEPLYVLDGFPVSNANIDPGSGTRYSQGDRNFLNTLNPNDIASIEILKDASATSIYGSRGCNGVILITTKRGSNGFKVDYSGNYSVQSIAKRPIMMNASEFMTKTNSFLYEEYLMRFKAFPYGTRAVNTLPAFRPKYSQDEIASAGSGTDWYGLITQQGLINQQNVSISKGSEDSKVLFSMNYFDQQGVIKTSGLRRLSGRLNVDQKLKKWLDFSISLTGSVLDNTNAALGGGENENSGIIQSALQYSPLIEPVRDANGEYLVNPSQALTPNPLSFLDITDNTSEKRWLTNAFFNIRFDKYASLKLTAGMDDNRALRNLYLPKTFMYGKGQNGFASIVGNSKTDYLTEATFSYMRDIAQDHSLSAVLGYSFQQFNLQGNSANTYDFFTDALLYNQLSAGSGIPIVNSYKAQSVIASYFGRMQYSFRDKYLFTFTARLDGSDKFGKNYKYGFFPSGAFAWKVTKEPFMQEQKIVSDLKLRLSLGQTGNSNIGNNAYEFYAANNRNYYFGGNLNTGVGLIQLPNPDLKWETTTEVNFGIDFGFFKNRISGSLELFYKQISDLLSVMPLSSNAIIPNVPANIGISESKGLEITLNSYNLTGELKWNSNFTLTSYRDKWLERNPNFILQPFEKENDPIRAVYGFIPEGIMQPGEVLPAMPQLMPGQMKIQDVNGDGKIDNKDMVLLGTNAPKFTLGLNNSFKYKNFDLSFFLYSSIGRLGFSSMNFKHGTGYEILSIKTGNNFLSEVQNSWSSTNTTSTMPSGFRNPYLLDGQYAHEDATYVRLRNLTLGYNFKGKLIKSNNINNCRLYVDAQNLWTSTNFSGLDPEIDNNSAPYPIQRTFSIGLNVTLN